MKKLLLATLLSVLSLQLSAATLAWNAINVNTSGITQSLDVDPQHLTGQVSFDSVSAPLTTTTDTWSYTLNGAEVVKNVALEFYDADMDIRSVYLDGFQLTASVETLVTGDKIRLWNWTGLLTSGVHTLYLNDISVKNASGQYQLKVSTVPVPAAVWLFGSALMGLVGVSRRKSTAVAA